MAKDDLQRAVDALVFPARSRGLPALSGAVPLPAATRAVSPAADVRPGGSGGIASPLTETAASRTHYPETVMTTTDGLFAVRIRRVQAVTMTDVNGAAVVFNYADE